MNRTQEKAEKRSRRHRRIRTRVSGGADRPRLAVFRSNKYLSAQLINDETGTTIVGLSTKTISGNGTRGEQAVELGTRIAEAAQKAGISSVVFDRGGYMYAGTIKAFADAARAGGLKF